MRPTSGLVGRASKNSLNGCFYAAMSAQSNIFQKRGLSERVKNICDCRGAEGDNPEGEAVVNDDLNGRQSRRTDRSIFTAVKMQDHVVQILLACGLGHRTALKCHRHFIHSRAAASLLRNQNEKARCGVLFQNVNFIYPTSAVILRRLRF